MYRFLNGTRTTFVFEGMAIRVVDCQHLLVRGDVVCIIN